MSAQTVWTHLEEARQAIESAGLVLPNPGAVDEQLDRAYASVVAAWNSIAYTPQDATAAPSRRQLTLLRGGRS